MSAMSAMSAIIRNFVGLNNGFQNSMIEITDIIRTSLKHQLN